MKSAIALVGVLALSAAAYADVPDTVTKAVADTTRPDEDRKADAIRDPGDTIAFAGVKPGMIVGELYPCGGYFSRMLSDVVGPTGKVYGLETDRWKDCAPADAKVAAVDKNFTVDVEPFGVFKAPQKLDLFWITQNYHDLHIKKYGNVDLIAFNKQVFAALKPGGTYFILDHQANPGTTEDQIAVLHRIEKAQLIREVEAAGFRLAGEGTFLHRPGDDHTKPIFDPAIRGKTDQYALKFIKP